MFVLIGYILGVLTMVWAIQSVINTPEDLAAFKCGLNLFTTHCP